MWSRCGTHDQKEAPHTMTTNTLLPVEPELIDDSLEVIGEWLEEIVHHIYERSLDAETETSYQEARERANDVFDRLSSLLSTHSDQENHHGN